MVAQEVTRLAATNEIPMLIDLVFLCLCKTLAQTRGIPGDGTWLKKMFFPSKK